MNYFFNWLVCHDQGHILLKVFNRTMRWSIIVVELIGLYLAK